MQPSSSGLPLRQEAEQKTDDIASLAGEDFAFPDPFACPFPASAAKDQGLAARAADLPAKVPSEVKHPLMDVQGDAMAPGESVAVAAPASGPGQHSGTNASGVGMSGAGAMVAPPLQGKGPEPQRSAWLQDEPSSIPEAQQIGKPAFFQMADAREPHDAAQSLAIRSSPSGAPPIGLDAAWQAHLPSLPRPAEEELPHLPSTGSPAAIPAAVLPPTDPKTPVDSMAIAQARTLQDHSNASEILLPPVVDAFARQSSARSEGSTPVVAHIALPAVGVEPAVIPAEPLPGAINSAKVLALADSPPVTGVQRGRQADGIALVLQDQPQPNPVLSDASAASFVAAAEGRPAPAASPGPHGLPAAPHPPQAQIAAVIVDQVRSGTPGLIEVSLSPIELGAIRFEMQQGPDGLHVHLAIERPETGDLVRRHVDQLVADLRAAGLGQATLSFGQWSQRQPADRQASTVPVRGPFALAAAEQVSTQPTLSASGRLHLRL
jgi:hypothetical protein